MPPEPPDPASASSSGEQYNATASRPSITQQILTEILRRYTLEQGRAGDLHPRGHVEQQPLSTDQSSGESRSHTPRDVDQPIRDQFRPNSKPETEQDEAEILVETDHDAAQTIPVGNLRDVPIDRDPVRKVAATRPTTVIPIKTVYFNSGRSNAPIRPSPLSQMSIASEEWASGVPKPNLNRQPRSRLSQTDDVGGESEDDDPEVGESGSVSKASSFSSRVPSAAVGSDQESESGQPIDPPSRRRSNTSTDISTAPQSIQNDVRQILKSMGIETFWDTDPETGELKEFAVVGRAQVNAELAWDMWVGTQGVESDNLDFKQLCLDLIKMRQLGDVPRMVFYQGAVDADESASPQSRASSDSPSEETGLQDHPVQPGYGRMALKRWDGSFCEKTHWDYLLQEMRERAVDWRKRRRGLGGHKLQEAEDVVIEWRLRRKSRGEYTEAPDHGLKAYKVTSAADQSLSEVDLGIDRQGSKELGEHWVTGEEVRRLASNGNPFIQDQD